MYAGVVAQAVASGMAGPVYCVIPAEEGAIQVWPRPTASGVQSEPPPELQVNGIVLGVVGDPNSGKSVFAGAVERCARRHFKTVWRLDCDAASPTPNWYLEMSRGPAQERVVALRAGQKRGWDERLEGQVAGRIQRCARRVHLTVADLPGGWFHDGHLERVPPGREVILEKIDCFIVLGKTGTDAANEWLRELEQRGWLSRVVAVLHSSNPDAEPSADLTVGDRWFTGTIRGLDRQRNEQEIDAALASALAPVFKALTQAKRDP